MEQLKLLKRILINILNLKVNVHTVSIIALCNSIEERILSFRNKNNDFVLSQYKNKTISTGFLKPKRKMTEEEKKIEAGKDVWSHNHATATGFRACGYPCMAYHSFLNLIKNIRILSIDMDKVKIPYKEYHSLITF